MAAVALATASFISVALLKCCATRAMPISPMICPYRVAGAA